MTDNLFTDPKSGVDYLVGEKFKSAQASAQMTGLRNLEKAAYRGAALNFHKHTHGLTAGGATIMRDSSNGAWLAFENVDSNPEYHYSPDGITWHTSSITSSNWTPAHGASNGSGRYMVQGTPTTAASDDARYRYTDNLTSFSSVNSSITASDGAYGIVYDGSNSLFVSFVDDGSSAVTIETSSDGTSWTQRTLPSATATGAGIATDNSSIIVALGTGATYWTSADGVTWTNRSITNAGDWQGVAYNTHHGVFLAVGDSGNIEKSSDGTSFSGSGLTDPTGGGADDMSHVVSFGHMFLVAVDGVMYVTEDVAVTWKRALTFDTGSGSPADAFVSDRSWALMDNSVLWVSGTY